MAKWTNQLPQIATEEDVEASWGGAKNGKRFRCYLCGYRFRVGDVWRFVYSAGRTITNPDTGQRNGLINLFVCKSCDGPDVLDRWVEANEEVLRRFWWARERE